MNHVGTYASALHENIEVLLDENRLFGDDRAEKINGSLADVDLCVQDVHFDSVFDAALQQRQSNEAVQ